MTSSIRRFFQTAFVALSVALVTKYTQTGAAAGEDVRIVRVCQK